MPRRRKKKKGSTSEAELIVEPKNEHTHTVIMLHGTYYDGTEFEDLPDLVRQEVKQRGSWDADGIKYIFPHSPLNEDGDNFWYDYLADDDAHEMQCDNDEIDLEQWNTQLRRIAGIVENEVAALGDSKKVFLGGNSAGGTIAIHVALHHCAAPLGGLFCLRTCPMRHSLGPAEPKPGKGEPDGSLLTATVMPVFAYQAGCDDTYIPELQARNYSVIEDAGIVVTKHVKPDGTHDEDDPEENPKVAEWIADLL
mmetsp:Transcript_151151/g.485577  ORF Transcript_151151/g.485577 Transcript_151151/m.485577 type:complete len:252 (-) Transcript_151151:114-869(-)